MGKTEDIKTIGVYLEEALDMGLEAEVVYYALRYMQEDPTMTPAQAMQNGADEWVNK